ncbi:MAG: hypothetical protein IV100_01955 [Myxococcales bacterium]|nr:hypothetical protein [Myxococcales bacterium]
MAAGFIATDRFWTTTALAFAAGVPAIAGARFPGEEHFVHTSADVESVQLDGAGRERSRTLQHYGQDSQYTGRTVIETTWRGDRRELIVRRSWNADGVIGSETETRFEAGRPGLQDEHVTTYWTGPERTLVRTELSSSEREKDGALLTTTTVRDDQGQLTETRYSLSRTVQRKGEVAFSATDYSVYDASGTQKTRWLIETRGDRTERWVFDLDDEITEHEVEVRKRNARGQIASVSSDTTDGRGAPLGAREEAFAYEGPDSQLSEHQMTWYDASGVGTQRRTSTTMFKGGKRSGARVSFERWETPAAPR